MRQIGNRVPIYRLSRRHPLRPPPGGPPNEEETDEHRCIPLADDGPAGTDGEARIPRVAGRRRGGGGGRRLRRLPHRPRLLLRRRAHQPAAAARPRPRGQRLRGRHGRRRRVVAGQGGDRAGGAALRRMRPVPARPGHHLPRAEDARQRYRGRLRLAHRRARARPLPGRRRPVGASRPVALAGLGRRRCAHHALPGRAPRGRDARQRSTSTTASSRRSRSTARRKR
jgi:hypothetical protein